MWREYLPARADCGTYQIGQQQWVRATLLVPAFPCQERCRCHHECRADATGVVSIRYSSSTTVVTKWHKRGDVCSDSDEQWLGGSAEKRTRRGGNERRGVRLLPRRRKVAEFRGRSEEPSRASQPPQTFEGTQALRGEVWLGESPSFFSFVFLVLRGLRHVRLALHSQNHEKGMGKHRERDVTVPPVPGAHLILIQAYLSFALFKTLLHGPTRSNSSDHLRQRRRAGGKDQHIGQISWLFSRDHTPPNDQRSLPSLLLWPVQLDACPIKEAWSLAPIASRETLPLVCPESSCDAIYPLALALHIHRLRTFDGQCIGLGALL